jgi:hypothetical protein
MIDGITHPRFCGSTAVGDNLLRPTLIYNLRNADYDIAMGRHFSEMMIDPHRQLLGIRVAPSSIFIVADHYHSQIDSNNKMAHFK